MVALDGRLSMPNLTLLLILGSAVAGLWLGPFFSTLINLGSVALFGFLFVEPRFDFSITFEDDLMLLVTTLVVSLLVSILTARLRSAVAQQAIQTERVTRLRRLSDSFVESDDASRHIENLLQAIRDIAQAPVSAVLLVRQNDHQEANSYCFFGKPRGRVRRELVRVVESPPETWYGPHERPGLLSIRICPKSLVLGAVCC
jgi:K+-sensing histidine kinase KdpD